MYIYIYIYIHIDQVLTPVLPYIKGKLYEEKSGKLAADLERNLKRLHSHALSNAISRIHVWYDAFPKHGMVSFPHLLIYSRRS